MPPEIKVGEPHVTIHHDYGVMVSEPDASVSQPSEKGLFFRDTRILSLWRLTIDGVPPILLNSANESHCSARWVLVNPRLRTASGEVKQHTLGVAVTRSIGPGMHEDFDLHNYGMADVHINLELELGSDFADLFEVKGHTTIRRGGITTTWSQEDQVLTTSYRHERFFRGFSARVRNSPVEAVYANGRIALPVALKPGESWHACMLYDLLDGDACLRAPKPCGAKANPDRPRPQPGQDRSTVTVRCASAEFERTFGQAVDDASALELHVPGAGGKPMPAGGVPWFLSLFGRDSLIASLQYRIVDARFARGTLEQLAALQATDTDAYRDAEPGKIPHELRHGELAFFGRIPHTPYYGTADATPLYLILLHSAWKCTGDLALLRRHMATAERCLEWIDRHGDLDGDGFQEYQTRSPAGYENQGWKDAGDAILYPDGSCVRGPKALCELQGYVFDAWLRMAEIFDALRQPDRAEALRRKAADLRRRFDDAFWDEEAGFYALALDGDKKRVMSIASNAGQCLWSGIVPRERAARVVARLLQPDLWNGWGIRTLSSRHPAFNPFSYQNGSVWPHDNGIIALGMKRYGFVKEAGEVARALCAAASHFAAHRLPELFAGTARDEIEFPLRYLGSNVPQAWATGAIFMFTEALIGFQPDAPAHRLTLDPALPDWLPELELRELPMGKRRFHLRFWREGPDTRFEVEAGDQGEVARSPMTVPFESVKLGSADAADAPATPRGFS